MARPAPLQPSLEDHLKWWGLRRFTSEAAYFQWQREVLSREDLLALNRLAQAKSASPGDPGPEIAFYDFAARPSILPVLYSQRYDYYCAVGLVLADRIGEARSVLDAGCGVGLLTTWYARRYPGSQLVGVDRSEASLQEAQRRAEQLGLSNLRFEPADLQTGAPIGRFDLILATQALFQSEQDPGLPSEGWTTFARCHDPVAQQKFERRTGLGPRLDHLCEALLPSGRLILLEKARHLGRRVPFQRALQARGFHLLETPIPIGYRSVEDLEEDGPLFVLGRTPQDSESNKIGWDEHPEVCEGQDLFAQRDEAGRWVWERLPERAVRRVEEWQDGHLGSVRVEWGQAAASIGYLSLALGNGFFGILVGKIGLGEGLDGAAGQALDRARQGRGELADILNRFWPGRGSQETLSQTPLYENHTWTAQEVWESLEGRKPRKASTTEEADGRQRHIELGEVKGLVYLYWANTYDQRQLVIVEAQRGQLLEEYYREAVQGAPGEAGFAQH